MGRVEYLGPKIQNRMFGVGVRILRFRCLGVKGLRGLGV